MLAKKGEFKNGAVLFFAKTPEKYFEAATIRCVAFRGITKRYISDDKIFGGPLYYQYLKAMEWLSGKLNISYDTYIRIIYKNENG